MRNQKERTGYSMKQEFSGYKLKRFLDHEGIKYGAFGKSLKPPVSIYTISKWITKSQECEQEPYTHN